MIIIVIAGLNKSAKINYQYKQNKDNNITITTTITSQTSSTNQTVRTTSQSTYTKVISKETYLNSDEVVQKSDINVNTKQAKVNSSVTTTAITQAESDTTVLSSTTDNEYISMEVPQGNTNFFAYMDYKTITNTSSNQYKFQQNCWTDSQGIRRQGDDYCVALGSYYSVNIGDRFIVSLDTGNTYTIVLADCKADVHTDVNNQFRWAGGNSYKNVIEFIVDTDKLSDSVKNSGNIGTYDNLSGNVVSIQKVI